MDIGSIGPIDELPDPDEIAVGTWTCPCGGVSWTWRKSYGAVSIFPTCPFCDTTGEVLYEEPRA